MGVDVCEYLRCRCVAGDRHLSRLLDVITDEQSAGAIVCPASAKLNTYAGSNLRAIVRQLTGQLAREDPSQEFKVCSILFLCSSALRRRLSVVGSRGVATGEYIGIYTPPPNQSTLNVFMWLFCLLDPFIPTQIKFLATPLLVKS